VDRRSRDEASDRVPGGSDSSPSGRGAGRHRSGILQSQPLGRELQPAEAQGEHEAHGGQREGELRGHAAPLPLHAGPIAGGRVVSSLAAARTFACGASVTRQR